MVVTEPCVGSDENADDAAGITVVTATPGVNDGARASSRVGVDTGNTVGFKAGVTAGVAVGVEAAKARRRATTKPR